MKQTMFKTKKLKYVIFTAVLSLFLGIGSFFLISPVMTVRATNSNNEEADDDLISDAINRLSRYYKNLSLVNGDDLTDEQLKKLKEICDSGRNTIAGSDDIRIQEVNDIEADTKKLMDDYVASCISKIAKTTVEYLAVGNIYDIPVGKYGDEMVVILPILNLGPDPLTNVIVTPEVSGKVTEFPFEISRGGFTHSIPFIAGSDNIPMAIQNRGEAAYAFRIREDVLDGYYKIDFKLVYERKGTAESATLSTYVKCIGAPGSASVEDGEGAQTSTPRIIVTGFSTEPEEVYAGSTFTLNIKVRNASQRTSVSNIQFDLKAAEEGKDKDTLYYSFLPTSGSNTIYVSELGKGEETTLEIEMSAKADLVQKPYAIDMTMKYEDEDYKPYESVTSISVPVKQLSRIEYSTAEIVPESITTGGQSNVTFSVYNTGKTILYNVKVAFEDPAVSGGDAYVGKLESGATGNVDVMLTGVSAANEVKGILSYENDAGNVTKVDFTIPLIIEEDLMAGGEEDYSIEDFDMEEMPTEGGGFPVFPVIIASVAIIAIVIIVIVIKKIKKKQKEKEINDLMDP